MRALSLSQPWASLVAVGAKKFETRSYPLSYRGPLAIHASKAFPGDAAALAETEPFHSALKCSWKELPLGAIVAVCELVYCLPTQDVRDDLRADALLGVDGERELAFGNYDDGRYALRLDHVVQLPEPVPCRGMLGLWTAPRIELPAVTR